MVFIITSNPFLDALFWFFAIVGTFSLLADMCSLIESHFKKFSGGASIVVSVKNQQETIEGFMQKLIAQNSSYISKIVVIDLGSTDDTPEILSHFARDYDFVHITDKEGYINSIKDIV